jgi:thioredoxin 1
MLAPVLNHVQEVNPDIEVEVIDVEAMPDAAKLYNVRSVPTVILLKDEKVMNTLVGALPKKVYEEAIQALRE